MAEYGAFLRDRESLDRQIAQTDDPAARRALELRRDIESAEYMAITSDRIAAQSEIIVGCRNTDEAVKQRARAQKFREEAKALREEYREIQKTRAVGREQDAASPESVAEKKQNPKSFKTPETRHEPVSPSKDDARVLMVEERPKGKPRGAPQPLKDFIRDIPLPPPSPRHGYTPAQIRNDPRAKRAHYAQLVAEENRGNALDRIGDDIKAGRNISADDIRKLSRKDLEAILEHGRDYMRQLVQERQRLRESKQEMER
jgi:hypothetical protein